MAEYAGDVKISASLDIKTAVQALNDLEKAISKAFGGQGITDFDKAIQKVNKNIKQTEQEIEKVQNEIDKTEAKMRELQTKQSVLLEKGRTLATKKNSEEYDGKYFTEVDYSRIKLLDTQLENTGAILDKLNEKSDRLKNSLASMRMNEQTAEEIKKNNDELEKGLSAVKERQRKITDETDNTAASTQKWSSEIENNTLPAFTKLTNKLIGMAKRVFVFSVITKSLRSLRSSLSDLVISNEQTRKSLYQLQAALYTTFTPVYNVIIPATQALIKWLTKAILYVSAFLNALQGKTLKQGIDEAKKLYDQVEQYKNSGKSSAEEKQINDEIAAIQRKIKALNKENNAIQKAENEKEKNNKSSLNFDKLNILDTPKQGNAQLLANEEEIEALQEQLDLLQDKKDSLNDIEEAFKSINSINTGFDDLSKLLDSADYENLNKFSEWVLKNNQAIKTALEIAGVIALIAFIAKLISGIGKLLGIFKKKDTALDKQTQKTNTEAESVRGLEKAFSLVPSAAFSVIPALNGITDALGDLSPVLNPQKVPSLIPTLEGVTSIADEASPAVQRMSTVTQMAVSPVNALTGELDKLSQTAPNVATAAQEAFQPLPDIVSEGTSPIPQILQSVVTAAQNVFQILPAVVSAGALPVPPILQGAFNAATGIILKFATQSQTSLAGWNLSSSSIVSSLAGNISGILSGGFNSELSAQTSWQSSSLQGFLSWKSSVINIIQTVVQALSNVSSQQVEYSANASSSTSIQVSQYPVKDVLKGASNIAKVYMKSGMRNIAQSVNDAFRSANTSTTGIGTAAGIMGTAAAGTMGTAAAGIMGTAAAGTMGTAAAGIMGAAAVGTMGAAAAGIMWNNLRKMFAGRLAQGAVIPPNREFLAVLGDQKHGTNVEAPLDTIKQAVAEVIGSSGGGNSGDINVNFTGSLSQLARVLKPQITREDRRIGTSLIKES